MTRKTTSFPAGFFATSSALILVALFAIASAATPAQKAVAAQGKSSPSASSSSSVPWTDPETIKPADLLSELAGAKPANRPVVVCAGFRILYEGAHVPGAVFHGPASKPEGLNDLKLWAQGIPRSSNLVVYCGCCPFDHCPNIRPAFETLRSMGFRRLRILLLPDNFATDWVAKGYPIEKGPQPQK